MTSTTVASTITSATTHTITGVVRHVARIARVFSPVLHGCTGGATAGLMPVWYAALDVFGAGTKKPGAIDDVATGAGCTGCVGGGCWVAATTRGSTGSACEGSAFPCLASAPS